MKRYNVRMAGIGGQGVVTASHIMGNAVIIGEGFATLVPFFGSEKRMAPVESYVRISDQKIFEIGEIVYPNVLMIFHSQVITHGKSYTMPFYQGLKENGIILINSDRPIDLSKEDQEELEKLNARVRYLPASKMAVEIGQTELATNMAMVGGMLGMIRIVGTDAIRESVVDRFTGGIVTSGGTASLDSAIEKKFKKKMDLIDKNMDVVMAAFKYAEDQGWVDDEPVKAKKKKAS